MIVSNSSRLGRPVYILLPGEYYASNCDCALLTVAGACVCVVLADGGRKIGGMGHFLVPGMMGSEGIHTDEIAAHGITQMEYLIGEIVKLRGDRRDLHAKIFGAGTIDSGNGGLAAVTQSNVRFLREYFSAERIPLVSEDLGGRFRRKMLFNPGTGEIFRRFQRRNEDSSEFLKLEVEYLDSVFRNKPTYGKVIMFE